MTLRQYQNLIKFLNMMINISHSVLEAQTGELKCQTAFCIQGYENLRDKALKSKLTNREKLLLLSDWQEFKNWSHQDSLESFDTSYHNY